MVSPNTQWEVGTPPHEYFCTQCQDENGFLVASSTGQSVWRQCSCVERKRIARLYKSSSISAAMQSVGFDDYLTQDRPRCVSQAKSMAYYFASHFSDLRGKRKNSMAIVGELGSGKTTILHAVSNSLIKQGILVHYFPWVSGTNELRGAFARGNSDKAYELVERLASAEVLFIDDLLQGRAEPTEYQKDLLYDVVNERYSHHRPLLISSNLTFEQINKVNEVIGSRIYEMCADFTTVMRLEADEQDMDLNFRLLNAKTWEGN